MKAYTPPDARAACRAILDEFGLSSDDTLCFKTLLLLQDEFWWNPLWMQERDFLDAIGNLPKDRKQKALLCLINSCCTDVLIAQGLGVVQLPAYVVPAIQVLDSDARVVGAASSVWSAHAPWPEELVTVVASALFNMQLPRQRLGMPRFGAPERAMREWSIYANTPVPAARMSRLAAAASPVSLLCELAHMMTEFTGAWDGTVAHDVWQSAMMTVEDGGVFLASGWLPAALSLASMNVPKTPNGRSWLHAECVFLDIIMPNVRRACCSITTEEGDAVNGVVMYDHDAYKWLATCLPAAKLISRTSRRKSLSCNAF